MFLQDLVYIYIIYIICVYIHIYVCIYQELYIYIYRLYNIAASINNREKSMGKGIIRGLPHGGDKMGRRTEKVGEVVGRMARNLTLEGVELS